MDEDEVMVVDNPQHEFAQFAAALCDLAQQVDVTRDDDARIYLLQAMAGISYMLSPPRGEVHDISEAPKKRK